MSEEGEESESGDGEDIENTKEIKNTKQSKKVSVQRYKGLGEMNADELAETTMEPDKRVLKQISVRDAQEADHLFDVLMGEAVAPRSKFIKSHARFVKDLDI